MIIGEDLRGNYGARQERHFPVRRALRPYSSAKVICQLRSGRTPSPELGQLRFSQVLPVCPALWRPPGRRRRAA
jgi:hypothetical protein